MTKICTITIPNEVDCVLHGLAPEHLNYFCEQYALHPPNYFFNPKFKLGSWDGKIRFFHSTGKTYVNLLEEIIPLIVKFGYTIKVIDKRSNAYQQPPEVDEDYFSYVLNDETGEPIKLRPYQVELINRLIRNSGGIGLAATGAGKTMATAALMKSYNDLGIKGILIVPSQDLIEQSRDDFIEWGLDTGEYSGDTKDIDHLCVVSTWQALQNNKHIMKSFQMVIVDECHGTKGQVLRSILNDYGHNIAYRFGVTGTIPKPETDAMAVKITLGIPQYTILAKELIDQGWLATLNIDIIQIEEDFHEQYDQYILDNPNLKIKPSYKQFKDSYFADYTNEKKYLQTNKERLQLICDMIEDKRNEQKGNVFCLVDGVNFGKKLAKLIPDAVFVYGKDKKKARRQVYQLFKENDNLVVIATVHIASTGLDIKRIFNLVFIDVGKSFIRVIQTIGRGLRKAPDKDHVNVMDITSDLKYGKKHTTERIKFYNEASYPNKKVLVSYNKKNDLFDA